MTSSSHSKSVLITDLDNTLFDWFNIWCATFIPLLEKTIEISELSREALIPEIKSVHEKHGTAEYAFLLQELPSLLKIYGSKKSVLESLDPAIHASRKSKKAELRLYEGVSETLLKLKSLGVLVVGYTESKEWYSKYRVRELALDGLLDIIYSPKDHDVPLPKSDRSVINLSYTEFRNTPEDELKPNPKLLRAIINDIGAKPDDCVYIGDSEIKDIDMAFEAGITSIFAKYGNAHFELRPDDYELLRKVTHWSPEMVERERELKKRGAQHKATFSVNSFSEILSKLHFHSFEKRK